MNFFQISVVWKTAKASKTELYFLTSSIFIISTLTARISELVDARSMNFLLNVALDLYSNFKLSKYQYFFFRHKLPFPGSHHKNVVYLR